VQSGYSLELQQRAAKVRLLVFDVDGVLTDGSLYLGDDGSEYKRFHSRDGQGLVMLRDAGLHIAIVSGRSSPAVAERMSELGIGHVYQGVANKVAALGELLLGLDLTAEQAAFLGDDLPDLAALQTVGLGIAVADAPPIVREAAGYVTQCPGGRGAVREVAELILDIQGLLQAQFDRYR
jgi:3-deoxy-D-manno-octulosonate 8-phosphate phosphatase (KDO 8-P phosphatase)